MKEYEFDSEDVGEHIGEHIGEHVGEHAEMLFQAKRLGLVFTTKQRNTVVAWIESLNACVCLQYKKGIGMGMVIEFPKIDSSSSSNFKFTLETFESLVLECGAGLDSARSKSSFFQTKSSFQWGRIYFLPVWYAWLFLWAVQACTFGKDRSFFFKKYASI